MSEPEPNWRSPQEPFRTRCIACGGDASPRMVEIQVTTPTYEGPLVLLGYQDAEGVKKLAINGTVFDPVGVTEGHAYLFATDLLGDQGSDIVHEALLRLDGLCDHAPAH